MRVRDAEACGDWQRRMALDDGDVLRDIGRQLVASTCDACDVDVVDEVSHFPDDFRDAVFGRERRNERSSEFRPIGEGADSDTPWL